MTNPIKAVFYTDAGYDAHQSTPVSGFGVHGYTFTDEVPKRGTGNAKAVPTDRGYEGPLDDKGSVITGARVTPLEYFDIIGGGVHHHSSGEAELNAFILALEVLLELEITHALIYCDARFVTQGVTEHLERWSRNNWKRADGGEVKYKETWQRCHALYDRLKGRCIVEVKWIKGHNGHLGNETSDKLATKGKAGIYNDPKTPTLQMRRPPEGYWNPKVEIPRLLQAPRWYFDTTDRHWIDVEGKSVYYVGSHGTKDKEQVFVGKPYADNYLGVVHCQDQNEALDALRRITFLASTAHSGRIVVGHLDKILSKNDYQAILDNGLSYHFSSKKQILIRDADKVELVAEMTPISQGYRMKAIWNELDLRLMEYRTGQGRYQEKDITDQLYEPHGKKALLKLRPNWTQKVKHIDVKALFNLEFEKDEPKPFEQKVRLIFGEDILSRNQLSAIADQVKAVKVITWRESDQVGRYATYVELTNGDFGLWARYEANYILTTQT